MLFRVSSVLGLILFGLILWSVDRQRTLEIITGANPLLLVLGIVMVAPEALFKALKLRSLARSQAACSLKDALIVYFVGIPFGAVTPGKVGDFVKVYSLSQRCRIRVPEALSIGVLDRLLDLIALVVFGALGVGLLLVNHAGDSLLVWAFGICLAGVTAMSLLLKRSLAARLAKPVLSLLARGGPAAKASAMLGSLFDAFYVGVGLARKSRRSLAGGLLYALLASVAISTRAFVFGSALGLKAALIYFVLLVPLVTLVELLPVSVLGLGTREYAVISIFAFLGVDREQALSLSLSSFVLSLTPLAVTGYLIALREHLRPGEVKPEFSGAGVNSYQQGCRGE